MTIVRGVVARACLLIPLLCGCRHSHLPPTVPVRGVVTFDGQACPGPGGLRFMPVTVQEGLPRRPGRAAFDKDGRFEVTSFREGDGLVPGTYRVQVECWQVEPAQGTPGVSFIAADYAAPDLVVAEDEREVKADYDVPAAAN
jgi:hypothetical protein